MAANVGAASRRALNQQVEYISGNCQGKKDSRITVICAMRVAMPPAPDLYDPLSPPLPHSYLIDPANGNVTILGALPEPRGMMGVVVGLAVGVLGRRTYLAIGTKIFIH